MQNFFEPADREPWRCATKYYRISWCVSAWPPSPASSACRNLTIKLLSRAAVEAKHCIRVCKRLTHCIRVRKRCGCTSSKWRHSSRYRDLVKHLAALNASAESAHAQERHWRTRAKNEFLPVEVRATFCKISRVGWPFSKQNMILHETSFEHIKKMKTTRGRFLMHKVLVG